MRAVRWRARLRHFVQSNGGLVKVCATNGARREKRFAASRAGREGGRLRGECANVNLRCRVRQIGRTAVRRFTESLRGAWGNAEEPCACAVRHAGHIGSSCAGGKCEFQSGRVATASRAHWHARRCTAFCIVNFSLKNKAEFEKHLRISARFGEGGIAGTRIGIAAGLRFAAVFMYFSQRAGVLWNGTPQSEAVRRIFALPKKRFEL